LPTVKTQKRLRVFAGPNGSGKTTIINAIRKIRINGRPIDFGIYINADDIAQAFRNDHFSFLQYKLQKVARDEFVSIALKSGLVNGSFPEQEFKGSFSLNSKGKFKVRLKTRVEHLAQIMAEFLRVRLLRENRKLSFETVFSHPSKIEFMRKAVDEGYKIYFYFIATESPEINISRIKDVRIKQGGHDVSANKVKARYKRSLDQLYDASQLVYQAYFFDNSYTDSAERAEYFAHFKVIHGKQVWDSLEGKNPPNWFIKYYMDKV
jgi:predicted ABC-type ATPase